MHSFIHFRSFLPHFLGPSRDHLSLLTACYIAVTFETEKGHVSSIDESCRAECSPEKMCKLKSLELEYFIASLLSHPPRSTTPEIFDLLCCEVSSYGVAPAWPHPRVK
jgi:hypothetical protein